jgi:uncharacterized protein (DUF362 family)
MRRFRLFLERKISRKKFLKISLAGLAYLAGGSYFLKATKLLAQPDLSYGRPKRKIKGDYDLVVGSGSDPYQITVKSIEAMGGMKRFVNKGSTVVIKPNIAWDRIPEQAANTNPQVVEALVELCFEAGAKRVNVFDITCNEARRCYKNSGIKVAAQRKGANVYHPSHWNYIKAKFTYKSPMQGWPILRDALECDTFINVPILKHHNLTRLTLSMKNLMGVCCGIRARIHFGIGRKLVDLTDFISPDLTVIDAFRVLVRHGPSGGDLADVRQLGKVIVATDPTLADSYAAKLMEVDPLAVPYIKVASTRGFGSADIDKANILSLNV